MDNSPELVVSMENICKSFNGVAVLKNINFDLRREIHAVVGHNGAGKSTLMQVLAGAYKADSGRICLNGREVNFNSPSEAKKKKIAMVWQELANFPNLSITENMMMQRFSNHKTGGIDWQASREACIQHLKRIDLDINPDTLMGNLSLAQQQLVEFARALSYNPEVLILDEPTSALSYSEQEILYEKVRLIKSQGVAIIYISHKLDEILSLSDRVSVFRDGEKIFTRDTSALNKDQIVAAIVGSEENEIKQKSCTGSKKAGEGEALGEVVVKIRELSSRRNLQNISLSTRRGELLGIVGVTGSGISDIGRILFGIERDYTGDISVYGKRIDFKSPMDAARAGVAYVPKDRKEAGIIPQMSVADNIILSSMDTVSRHGFVKKSRRNAKVDTLMSLIELLPRRPEMPIGSLSGGNQQKGVIARWINKNSGILILDEPTRGVDVGAINKIYSLIKDLVQQGHCVILISSEFEEVHSVADRLIVLKEGMCVGEMDPGSCRWEDVFALAIK